MRPIFSQTIDASVATFKTPGAARSVWSRYRTAVFLCIVGIAFALGFVVNEVLASQDDSLRQLIGGGIAGTVITGGGILIANTWLKGRREGRWKIAVSKDGIASILLGQIENSVNLNAVTFAMTGPLLVQGQPMPTLILSDVDSDGLPAWFPVAMLDSHPALLNDMRRFLGPRLRNIDIRDAEAFRLLNSEMGTGQD